MLSFFLTALLLCADTSPVSEVKSMVSAAVSTNKTKSIARRSSSNGIFGPDLTVDFTTQEAVKLCKLPTSTIPELFNLFADIVFHHDDANSTSHYVFFAVYEISKLKPPADIGPFYFHPAISISVVSWYQNRHTVPERFAKSDKSWLTAKDADKGILSTSKVVFDAKKSQQETITELTGFGKAMLELRAYGLDAVPLIVEQFEAEDYHLRWLFEDLTDRTKAVAIQETAADRCKAHVKWWRDPSEHAEAIKYQMPPLDAGKNFKPPELKKK